MKNMEFFLVRIFLYLDWIQENTDQKKPRIYELFTQYFEKTNQHGRKTKVAVGWEGHTLLLLRGWRYGEVYRLKWAGLHDSNNYVSFRTYSYLWFILENSVKIIYLEFLLCENKKKVRKMFEEKQEFSTRKHIFF